MALDDLLQKNGTKVYQVSLRKLADELGQIRFIGVASLGALAAIDDRIDMKQLEKTIISDSKLQRFEKKNHMALHGGAKAITLLKL